MYKSPIEFLMTDIHHQIVKKQEEDIYKAVLHYAPNVDKDELIRALKYDRGQYEKGFRDGKAAAMSELVRCKDCIHWYDRDEVCLKIYSDGGVHSLAWQERKPDDFCSYGERREDDGNL